MHSSCIQTLDANHWANSNRQETPWGFCSSLPWLIFLSFLSNLHITLGNPVLAICASIAVDEPPTPALSRILIVTLHITAGVCTLC